MFYYFIGISLLILLGRDNVVRALVGLGANMNAEDRMHKETPLHYAVTWGICTSLTILKASIYVGICFFIIFFVDHENVVRALIELGANVLAKNANNKTPREIAEGEGKIL